MRSGAGVVLLVIGSAMCAADVWRRFARRDQEGGLIRSIWAPAEIPVAFYVGFALLIGGSFLVFGTVNP
jgi:hypothetical protein